MKGSIFFLLMGAGFIVKAQTFDDLKRQYISDDGLYIERLKPSENIDRYTVDNKIYTVGKKFIYSYYILKRNDTLKVKAPREVGEDADIQKTWELIPSRTKSDDKIETISISIQGGMAFENQTAMRYEFGYATGNFQANTGLIENKLNTWLHPPKERYFMILQLNPYPYIQEPFDKGYQWTWTQPISDRWQDSRWKSWKGPLRNIYQYTLQAKEILETKFGPLECWVVEGVAVNSLGTTGLIAYFNLEKGFMKLEYTNIDKSQLIMELQDIK